MYQAAGDAADTFGGRPANDGVTITQACEQDVENLLCVFVDIVGVIVIVLSPGGSRCTGRGGWCCRPRWRGLLGQIQHE